jgi:hypothetical protein
MSSTSIPTSSVRASLLLACVLVIARASSLRLLSVKTCRCVESVVLTFFLPSCALILVAQGHSLDEQ